MTSGRIQISGNGLGEPIMKTIESRASENAAIEGRPNRATIEDYEKAAEELGVEARFSENGQAEPIEEGPESRDLSEIRGDNGQQIPDIQAEDETKVTERLVKEGVEEADHEQMLRGRMNRGEMGGQR